MRTENAAHLKSCESCSLLQNRGEGKLQWRLDYGLKMGILAYTLTVTCSNLAVRDEKSGTDMYQMTSCKTEFLAAIKNVADARNNAKLNTTGISLPVVFFVLKVTCILDGISV